MRQYESIRTGDVYNVTPSGTMIIPESELPYLKLITLSQKDAAIRSAIRNKGYDPENIEWVAKHVTCYIQGVNECWYIDRDVFLNFKYEV